MEEYQTYEAIYVLDQNGQVVFTAPTEKSDTYLTARQRFLSKSSYISNIQVQSSKGNAATKGQHLALYFSAPLFDKGEFVGAVVEQMRFDAIEDILRQVEEETKSRVSLVKGTEKEVDHLVSGINYTERAGSQYMTAVHPIQLYPT